MAEELLIIYVIIATTGALTSLVTAIYYWRRLKLEHDRSAATEKYYNGQLAMARQSNDIEKRRADDAEKYYSERVKFEMEKLEVERGKLEAEHEKIAIEKQKLAIRNGPAGKP